MDRYEQRMIVHASGGSVMSPYFASLKERKFSVTSTDEMLVVTYSDGKNRPHLLERQMADNGIPLAVCMIDGVDPFKEKIPSLKRLLNSSIRHEWIMGVDAFDVIIDGNLSELLEHVKSNGYDAFFGAEWGFWPPSCKTKEEEIKIHPSSLFQFLNSGVWVAKTEWLRSRLESVRGPIDDQLFFKSFYVKEHPRVEIDHEARFIMNLNGLDREIGHYTKEENRRLLDEARERVSDLEQKELGVLFCCHRKCRASESNFESFRKSSPWAELIYIDTDELVNNAFWTDVTQRNGKLAWVNADAIYYEAYRRRTHNCKRWLLAEWDLFCNGDIREFFGPLWDKPFVSSVIRVLGEKWEWFQDRKDLPKWLQQHCAGCTPLAGTLISDECMEGIVSNSWWVRHPVFCEMRIATLAKAAGFDLSSNPRGQGLRWRPTPTVTGPGLWHPMKSTSITIDDVGENPVGRWLFRHREWSGEIEILPDSSFVRVELPSECGVWRPMEGGIILEWRKWPSEEATLSDGRLVGRDFVATRVT